MENRSESPCLERESRTPLCEITPEGRKRVSTATRFETVHGFFRLAGSRYWTASLLPAFLGTALPFWLRPQGFSFRWLPAIEFLAATLLFHAGFSFLQARMEGRSTANWTGYMLLRIAGTCIAAGCLLGLHIDYALTLHSGVPGSIFIVYGLVTLFAGVLYVVPPFRFYRRVGGEVLLAEGLGLVPVLGAYLVQVGDLTRSVYLASLPVVVATGLWVWTDELVSKGDDEATGRRTMVMIFPARFSGRYVTVMITVLLYATLIAAVLVRSSLPPLSLAALLTLSLGLKIVSVSWNEHANPIKMAKARVYALLIHLIVCVLLGLSSLVGAL